MSLDGQVKYLSVVQVENKFAIEGHMLTNKTNLGALAEQLQRNRQFRTSFYHRLNLQQNKDSRSESEELDRISEKSMITPV